MIIRPYKINENNIQDSNNIFLKNIKISPRQNIRIDSESIINKNNNSYSIKDSLLGDLFNEKIYFKKHFKIMSDCNTGEIIDYSSCINHPFITYPKEMKKNDYEKLYINTNNLKDYNNYKVIYDSQISDEYSICLVDIFEDEFQLPYIPTAGSILSFFSSLSILLPFEIMFIIDSDIGYNFQSLKTRKIYKSAIIENLNKYFELFSSIYDEFKHICDIEQKSLRIFIFNHTFGNYIKIIDKQYPYITFLYDLNLTDHHKILQANEISDKNNYSSSNLFHILTSIKIPTIIDTFGSLMLQGEFNDRIFI